MVSTKDRRESLQFESLQVRRMPGLESAPLEIEDFSAGINVLYGPNAIGKTTLARALNLLIWPDRFERNGAHVSARFSVGDANWYVEYDAGNRRFQREGSSSEPPPLPSEKSADRYNLALHDLLQSETRNRSFAERIVQELSGGYDLDAAADELAFSNRPSGRGKATRRAEDAVRNLRESRKEAEDREREERRLRDMNRQLGEAERARDRVEYLKQLKQWHEAKERYQRQKAKLQNYPDALKNFSGDERSTLEELDRKIDTVEREKEEVNNTIEEARMRQNELEVPDEENLTGIVRELKHAREELQDHESEIDQLESRLEKLRTRRTEAAKALGADRGLEELDRASFEEYAERARREEETRSRLEALETYRNLLHEEETEDPFKSDYETLQNGCERLETWLAHPEEGPPDRRSPLSRPLVTSSIAIAALAVVTGAYVHAALYAFLAVPVVLHFWSWVRRNAPENRTNADESSVRRAARRKYERLDLSTEPDCWTREGVREQLEMLYTQRAGRRLYETRSSEWERREEEYERLRAERKQLTEDREQFAGKYGFSVDDGRTLLHFVNRLSRWQDAHEEVEAIKQQIDHYRTLHDERLDEVNEELNRWDLGPVKTAYELGSRVQEMEERVEVFEETIRTLEQANDKQEQLQNRLPELREKRDDFFEDLGLEPGDDSQLRKHVEQLEDYRRQKKTVEDAQAVLRSQHDALTAGGQYEPAHEEWNRGRLERAIDEARSKADNYEDIQENITRIKTKIEEAKQGYEIEPARAEKERSLEALHEQFLEDCRALIGNDLRRYLESTNSERTSPAVFDRARERLSTITAGRYRLDVTPSTKDPSFRVIDSRTGAGKGFGDISSGTRIQVLMAVRLAFVENNENRLRLPLYLDETLANADDAKARTIIETVEQMARAGRQVFYFTAQGDEVSKWEAFTDSGGRRLIDLGVRADRTPGGSVDIPDPASLESVKNEPPSAEGLSHEEYGKQLEVPPLDPQAAVGSVHLWYLVEELGLLEELLSKSIERWGPLETLFDVTDRNPLGSDRPIEPIRQRAAATQTFLQRWRHGRHQAIDRSVLVETDAVSENFLDEVSVLAEECEGNPEIIIERLREGAVTGFRSKKIDELERYFRDNDYLDSRDPLDDAIIRNAMMSTLNPECFEESPERIIDRLLKRIRTRMNETTSVESMEGEG